MSPLETAEYQNLLKLEGARLAGVEANDLTVEVPHLEGWTVYNVVGHTGWVYHYVAQCLQSSPESPPSRSAIGEPPAGPDVLDWFSEAAKQIEAAFESCDLDSERPTFTGPQPARWWLRRLSHEVSIHRWDALASITAPEPIDAAQARDGIDEILEVFAPKRMQFETLAGSGETIHLHAIDIDDGEWLLELQPDSIQWEHGHAKADVAARGTSSDLLLLMWGRIPPARLQVFGDSQLLDRWQGAATF